MNFKHGLNIVLEPAVFSLANALINQSLKDQSLEGQSLKIVGADGMELVSEKEFDIKKLPKDLLEDELFCEVQELGDLRSNDGFKLPAFSLDVKGEKEINISGSGAFLLLLNAKNSGKVFINYSGEGDLVEFLLLNVEKDVEVEIWIRQKKTSGNVFQRRYVYQKGSVFWREGIFGGDFVQNMIFSFLDENARNNTNMHILGKEKQRFDSSIVCEQRGRESYSNTSVKGVVLDSARVLCRGVTRINKEAVKSEGYEKQELLVFGDEAQANAIPNLEICNHTVSCSHGSSIGRVNEEDLFYLQSRGLDEVEAKKLFMRKYLGPFADEVIDEN